MDDLVLYTALISGFIVWLGLLRYPIRHCYAGVNVEPTKKVDILCALAVTAAAIGLECAAYVVLMEFNTEPHLGFLFFAMGATPLAVTWHLIVIWRERKDTAQRAQEEREEAEQERSASP